MTKRLSIASALLTVFAALLALLLLSSPAFGHHKSSHDKGKASTSSKGGGSDHDGDADSDRNTRYTEDNDTNDNNTPNNVPDDGDNKHPSGKDRSVENGKSGNQGKSESDPDDDGRGPDRSNGGPDKPNGSGGDDLADQDGNNGCGNDDDFEDDNEGWCGGKPKDTDEVLPESVPTPTPTPCPTPMTNSSSTDACSVAEPDDVLGDDTKSCPEDEAMAADVKDCEPTVLGSIISAGTGPGDDVEAGGATADDAEPAERAAGAVLPFTGGSVVLFLVIAMGLLGTGFALFRTRRS